MLKNKHSNSVQLGCFSPPVMFATFLIEVLGALWIFYRYRSSFTARLMMTVLFLLGFFQLAEFMVCEGALGISSLDWARLGYVAITLLPPLGLHLGLSIAKKKKRGLLLLAYASAAAFSAFFLLAERGMQGGVCLGNYALFEIAQAVVVPYFIYYYGWLALGVAVTLYYAAQKGIPHRIKDALRGLALGYIAFIAPTTFVNVVDPSTVAGIPSIMCGFAVILAFVLLFWVAPRVLERR